ncbi:MAG: CHRD domain-containing protein [Armatimonadota bacterium]
MPLYSRIALVAGALLFLAPASNAQIQTYVANLSGLAEDTPNNSSGTGFSTVTLNLGANTMRVQISFTGLGSNTTASHIHSATATPLTGAVGVATQTPTFPGFPAGVTAGTYDQTFDMTLASSYNPAFVTANGGTALTARDALFAGIAGQRAYVNIHTTQFPGGEIRGFLVAAPEPGSLALLGGIAAVGLPLIAARRRRRTA